MPLLCSPLSLCLCLRLQACALFVSYVSHTRSIYSQLEPYIIWFRVLFRPLGRVCVYSV
jgi:hypothetical protein